MAQPQIIILVLAAIYVLTFLAGFLQATPLNFVNYILFFALFVGGVMPIRSTVQFEVIGFGRWALYATAATSMLLFALFVVYDVARLAGYGGFSASMEGSLYLVTLLFFIAGALSLAVVRTTVGDPS